MLLLSACSTNGWLPSGHAMRMALDLGLHRALDKLAENNGKIRSEEEERNLGAVNFDAYQTYTEFRSVVSARIWLCLYWFDHQYAFITESKLEKVNRHLTG